MTDEQSAALREEMASLRPAMRAGEETARRRYIAIAAEFDVELSEVTRGLLRKGKRKMGERFGVGDPQKGEIYAAMGKVMAEVGAVTKARRNVQQNYAFRGIDDVVAHLQPVMAAAGVVCIPRVLEREREMVATKAGGSMCSVRLLVEHVFYAKDGSSVSCVTLGEALDTGDKASNKAMSAALKYALTESFAIPTYEADRDTEEASPEVVGAPKAAAPPSRPRLADAMVGNAAPAPAPHIANAQPRSGAVFPNYGRNKGAPVTGATAQDLEFYRSGCLRSIADPAKERFHAQERTLLAAIEAELRRQAGTEPGDDGSPPPHSDGDAPF